SMSRIRSAVDHQATTASANRMATSAIRVRAAAHAGASPGLGETRSGAAVIIASGGPGEPGLRQSRLAFVLDAERVDLRALGLRHREVGGDGMEHAVELDGVAVLDTERHDVLDLEVDGVADAHAVLHPVVLNVDVRPLDAEDLADERRKAGHRA